MRDRAWAWVGSTSSWVALLLGALTAVGSGLGSPGAAAAECPGHPNALGTSRVLVVDPQEHPRIGAMQYKETLPLRDHEVVLTFDDGPVPKYSNQVLQILADECVKATFFTIGRQAKADPEGVRKLAAAGHTVGTHSQNHPLSFNRMTLDQVKPEVDQGIASTAAALSDPSALSPFFRVPGLLRGEAVENYAGTLGLQMWSADFLADDWRSISGTKVYELAIKRLEARGKGILLLHDIHARTVDALPKILTELKAKGYRIVHVVAATPDRPATPTEPDDWLVHRPSDETPVAKWPAITPVDLAAADTRARATLDDFGVLDPLPASRAAPKPAWPRPALRLQTATAPALPAPSADLFAWPPATPLTAQRRQVARVERPAVKPAPRPVRMASLKRR
ncbi:MULTISPECIES: polysaccharide deacetylase family protein [Bradyrhizobium]|uniref:Chitooligosaccharide deacetylase n=2 Tax=Bradyrhizobium TaxID=374 RepID=A0ABS5GJA0_9BRAD|nr:MULTISPECIES: polysaccharide deacetylase family protein [Bradyrhizobium]MBR1141411.1 polysaccharide deacetylase family protein [Bradyrhizobium denitrificans]MDU0957104.1 polysaccharide deacetylase family protein [Bradyrhizobium sp.]MDU1496283.1 polysaccharide deacetylase family protein [Bradyrhizobium sp.]MDU1546353.1 polysaccharide deacetylase family protein [Bradyrhizobium sp.]MDU1670162.1 polysaccharide deacetylase family protein [Bradyrhizobium sp.]